MDMGAQPSQIALQYQIQCQLSDPEQTCSLVTKLLTELLRYVPIPNINHLQRIIFVYDDHMISTVNEILQDGEGTAGSHSAGSHMPTAITVPKEKENELHCSIIISKSSLLLLTEEHYHPASFVSSLLEELLHVLIYSAAWEEQGYVQPPLSFSPQTRDLFVQCSRLHDEYMVARWKTRILGNGPLVDGEENLVIYYPAYGNLVAPILDRASLSLRQAVSGSGLPALGNRHLLNVVYREVFEPLGRNAGFQAATPLEKRPMENNPEESLFFQEHVASFWEQINTQLERSFQSGLAEMTEVVTEMMKLLAAFLAYIEKLYR